MSPMNQSSHENGTQGRAGQLYPEVYSFQTFYQLHVKIDHVRRHEHQQVATAVRRALSGGRLVTWAFVYSDGKVLGRPAPERRAHACVSKEKLPLYCCVSFLAHHVHVQRIFGCAKSRHPF